VSPLPDNVVVLAERRPVEMQPLPPPPAQPYLRLVRDGESPTPFGLDVFLARAQLVLAETEGDTGDEPAMPAVVLPLHARQA
jgi:hypothetical protein